MKKFYVHNVLFVFLLLLSGTVYSQDWPTEYNTGPSGTLTSYSGDITTTTDGQIIENLDISGAIHVRNSNVIIRNCEFSSLDITATGSVTNTLVEDCQLNWAGRKEFTMRRCKMIGQSNDLIRISGPNVVIEDCFLHITGPRIGEDHSDIIQEYPENSGVNTIIRHNSMLNAMGQTSAMLGVRDALIENNLLAGGSYTLYTNSWQTVKDNHFSTMYFPTCGQFGPTTGTAGCASGNVWHETGLPVNISCIEPCVIVPATGVTLSPSSLSLDIGGSSNLQMIIQPLGATNQNVTWTSSNTSVASVNSNGTVIGLSQGTSVITVTTEDGGFSASSTVTVNTPTGDYNLALNKTISVSSYQDDSNGTYPGANLIDGDTNDNTRWTSSGYPQWAEIDLGQDCNISAIQLYTYQSRAYQYIIDAKPEGGSYSTIVDRSGNTDGSQPITDAVSSTARYIKITVSGASGYTGTYISLNELQIIGTPGTSSTVSVTGISVSPTSLTLNTGEASDLTETISPSNATNKSVSWSSSNTSVATVDANGVVSGLSDGQATITVTTNDGGYTATCSVTVNTPTGDYNLALNKSVSVSAYQDDSDGTYPGSNLVDGDISDNTRWSASGFPQWAEVDLGENCDISSLKVYTYLGRAYQYIIEAKPEGGSYSTIVDRSSNTDNSQPITDAVSASARYVKITVSGASVYTGTWVSLNELQVIGTPGGTSTIAVSGVSVSPTTLSLTEGATSDLTETVSPSDATDQSVSWASNNTAVATVDANGLVSAVAEGTANITVTTTDGGYTASCTVTVSASTPGQTRSLTISGSTDDREVRSDGSIQWEGNETARIGGASGTADGALVIPFQLPVLSADETILEASFSSTLKTIANSPGGHVDVYAMPYSSSSSVTGSDFYQGAFDGDANATGIQDDYALSTMSDELLLTIDATASEDLASFINAQYAAGAQAGDYIFIRLNPDISDVGSYHYWVFYTANSANIPELELTIESTSVIAPTSVSLSSSTLSLDEGETAQLTETVLPSDATDKSVSWSSDNTSVATVANGLVSAINAGTANITVTTSNGLTAVCSVTVIDPTIYVSGISVSPTTLSLLEGETANVTASISPTDATNQTVAWSSGNTSVATVNSSGNVTAITEGTTNITVTSNDGGFTAVCAVTVSAPVADRTVVVSASTDDREVRSDGSIQWEGNETARVGGASGSADGALVIPFQLPALSAGETILEASFSSTLKTIANSPGGHVDLYAMPYSSSSSVTGADFYQGAFDSDANATGIQDDYALISMADELLLTIDETASEDLASFINAQYAAGAQAGDYVFIRLNPDINDVGSYHYWVFYTADSDNAPEIEFIIGSDPSKSNLKANYSNSSLSQAQIKVWPNPSTINSMLNIEVLGMSEDNTLSVKIVDVTGKILYLKNNANTYETINLKSFDQGMYILLIDDGSKKATTKLLIK